MSNYIKVSPARLSGEVTILPSKSYVQRYLIAAALSDAGTEMVALTQAHDVFHTMKCLNTLGADIKYTDGNFMISPIGGNLNKNTTLDCGENGTLLRFITPIATALGAGCTVDGTERLRQRPIADLLECLKANGLETDGNYPMKLGGKLVAGDYKIKGTVSSQFISGLLFALPLLDGDSRLIIEGELVSESYVNITLDVLQQFGVQTEKTDYGFKVHGNQKYITPKKIIAEGDWSNAAFFLVAGAVNGDINVKGMNINSKQGDMEILNILEKSGANIKVAKDCIKVQKSKLIAFESDAKHIPDLVPIVSVLAANAVGETVIKNVERLRDKESDRLAAVLSMLGNLGIKASSDGKTLTIHGGRLNGGNVDGVNDHRIVMSGAVAALNASGEIEISDAHAIKKSYPTFYEEFIKLGGSVK